MTVRDQESFLVRGGGDAVHRHDCRYAKRKGMVRWRWAEAGDEFWWDDGHPVMRSGKVTQRVMWLHACQVCRPDLADDPFGQHEIDKAIHEAGLSHV